MEDSISESEKQYKEVFYAATELRSLCKVANELVASERKWQQ